MELKDFQINQEPSLSLDDLVGKSGGGIPANEKTARQVAATSALLVNTDPKYYRQFVNTLTDPNTVEQYSQFETDLAQGVRQMDIQEFGQDIMSNELSNEDKVKMAIGAGSGDFGPTRNFALNTFAQESLVADSEGESEADAEQRFKLADTIDKVQDRKRRIQQAINAVRVEQDPTTLSKVGDIAELFVPLAEWIDTTLLFNDIQEQFDIDDPAVPLLGNQRNALFEQINNLPDKDKEAATRALIDIVEDNAQILFPDGNDIVVINNLNNMLVNNEYSQGERWLDNFVSVLDVVGVAWIAKGFIKAGRGAKATSQGTTSRSSDGLNGEILDPEVPNKPSPNPDDIIDLDPSEYAEVNPIKRRAISEATTTEVGPVAPSQIVKDTNPGLARRMHKAADEDASEEAAQALYGASRDEALAKDVLPSTDLGDGAIPNKVHLPEYDEPAFIKKARRTDGNTIVNDRELGVVRKELQDRISSPEGFKLKRGSMSLRANLDGTTTVRALYLPGDSGYATANDAIQAAEVSFRNYGLTKDNFTVMKREGGGWKPVKPSTNLEDGDFAVSLDFNYRFRPEDLNEVDLLSTGNFLTKILDRSERQRLASVGQGSVVQNIFDPSSVIHPQIVNAASVAVDRAFGLKKLYVDLFEDFTQGYKSLPNDRRLEMTNYIEQANLEGLKFNVESLRTRFKENEIEILRRWRRANDIMWHGLNEDMVKNLRAKGYVSVIDQATDTKVMGRPVAQNSVNTRKYAFDSTKNTIAKPNAEDLKRLYDEGGEIVSLDEPLFVDGEFIEYIVSYNKPNSSYSRAIYDSEKVLPYQNSYYPVIYDANLFIQQTVVARNGEKFTKTIGTAKTRKDLDDALTLLRSRNKDAEFTFIDKAKQRGAQQIFDDEGWALMTNRGLTSQRVRGKRLEPFGEDTSRFNTNHLLDPLEAVGNQIHALSQKIAMRQFLETAKRRWMLNYGKYLEDMPVDPDTGKTFFPRSVSEIKGKTGVDQNLVADARSNYNYLYGLENGYINGIDEVYRGAMNMAAEGLASLGLKLNTTAFSQGEAALRSGTGLSPTQGAKTTAFKLFLSASPIRQSIVQRGQIIMLGAINPSYFTTKLVKDVVAIDAARAGVKVSDQYKALLKEVETSGIFEAVNAHSLIREDVLRLADLTYMQKGKSALGAPFRFLQSVGFDLAERDNLLASYLAHRDLAIKAGENIADQRVRDRVLGQARAYTLMMNRAGEMPYSQSTLSLAAQFFSFRHKALLQAVTNKSLTKTERAKVLGYSIMMFGPEATIIAAIYNEATKDFEMDTATREAIADGLLDYVLNQSLTMATGEQQSIDFGDLAPTEAYGMGQLLDAMLTTNPREFVENSPAGSLLFGANPRINDMVSTLGKYFNVFDDYDDPELNTRLSDVLRSSLNLFSGYSAAFKANYALKTGQKMSSTGNITDEEVTAVEALMAVTGFQTKTETGYREATQLRFEDETFTTDDVRAWYNDLKRHLARRGERPAEDVELKRRVLAEAFRVFGEDRPKAVNEIRRLIENDAKSRDYKVFRGLLREIGYMPEEDLRKIINALPDDDVRKRLNTIMEMRGEDDG